MYTAGHLCLSVLSSFFALAWAVEPLGQAAPCSSLVAGVLYGSFSLRDLFPRPSALASGCSWTVENPDPTKYSLYFRFNRHAGACLAFSPLVLPLDHYLSNQTCGPPDQPTFPSDPEAVELCMVPGPHTFLQFDKNFVQLCLTTHPNKDGDNRDGLSEGQAPLSAETLDFRLVEVLLINNENSSQFTCGVLCRWFEECLHVGSGWETESCSITQSGCVCPNTVPPVSLLPTAPHNHSLDPSHQIHVHTHTHTGWWKVQLALKGKCTEDVPGCRLHTTLPQTYVEVWCLCLGQQFKDFPFLSILCFVGDPAAEEWSQWSVCSLTCGQGWQVRSRSCVSSPYGTLCSGPLRETRLCNNTATCSVHGLWEEWSSCSLCSVTCGRGTRTRSRICVLPQHGSKGCGGPEVQTKLCNIAVWPVEGQWLDWATWSQCSVSCGSGTQQRQRRCSVSVHGWAECKGPHEVHSCNDKKCPGVCGGNWGAWNHWSLCSKTCDSGWQRRFRMCEGTGIQGYPCEGSGEEVHSCNDKKCPAPHEICKDEYQVAMTWKRASAGETVYNKCPSNATGTSFRRCLLDANGVAYWGPPSFARCVSLEYRYLHLSVSTWMRMTHSRAFWSSPTTSVSSHSIHKSATSKCHVVLQYKPLKGTSVKHLIFELLRLCLSLVLSVITIQREPVSAVSSDINFPMKGRRGMKDWARSADDKLFIPKEVFTLSSDEHLEWGCHRLVLMAPYSLQSLALPHGMTQLIHSFFFVPCLCVLSLYPINREAGEENWDAESCQTFPSPAVSHTKCLCSKLSTFAVLAQKAKEPVSAVFTFSHHTSPLSVCSGWGLADLDLGEICLIYLILRYIRSERSIILVNFCLSILASNVLILVGQSQTLSKGLCTVTAAFLHFFFLASFCWVLTEAWQSYLAVNGKMRSRLIRKRFLCLGWGLPALVVAVSVGFTRARGYGTPSYCWLSLEGGLLYAFVGPAAVIVLGIVMELLCGSPSVGTHMDVSCASHHRPPINSLPGALCGL
uniref:Adhesion G protein-coupled receptor B2 n=1 Tax=Sinocyclocheilus rhinocerous TaxID=307959 RepID=A0A673M3G7_9TELE